MTKDKNALPPQVLKDLASLRDAFPDAKFEVRVLDRTLNSAIDELGQNYHEARKKGDAHPVTPVTLKASALTSEDRQKLRDLAAQGVIDTHEEKGSVTLRTTGSEPHSAIFFGDRLPLRVVQILQGPPTEMFPKGDKNKAPDGALIHRAPPTGNTPRILMILDPKKKP